MPKKDQGWITFQSSAEERSLLEAYCRESHRSKTEVLRELLRSLNQPAQELPQPVAPSEGEKLHHPLTRISARNKFKGKVKQVLIEDINAEVIVELAPGVNIVSVMSKASVEQIGIFPGKEVYVVIKSSDVMMAVDQ